MALSRGLSVLGIGQSYIVGGYSSTAYYGFMLPVLAAIVASWSTINAGTGLALTAADLVQFRDEAVGGSAIVEADAGAAGYWVKDDFSNGPILDTTLAAIAGWSAKPAIILHSHGQQEAAANISEAQSFNAKQAIHDTLWPQVRSAINPSNAANMPIWVDMIGPRYPGNEFAEFYMRDRFIELIDDDARVYRGSETYHLPLATNTHPTLAGYKVMGAHTGRKVANWLVNKTDLPGPSIASATIVSGGVDVTITVPAGQTLIKPARPDYFGIFDASERKIPITGYSWAGNVLHLACAGAAKLRYPINLYRQPYIENIIRLDNQAPLFAGEPGLVLESVKTIILA